MSDSANKIKTPLPGLTNLDTLSLKNGERRLIRRALAGDQPAYQSLYDLHVDRVYRLAYRMLRTEDQAMEATQATFIRAFRKLEGFRGDAAFSTWLHQVAVSVILNHRRVVSRRDGREAELTPDVILDPPRSVEPDIRARLHRAIDELSEIYRTVFLMHDLEGFKHEEIAEALGVAVGTSKARLSRARAMLRQTLGPEVREAIS